MQSPQAPEYHVLSHDKPAVCNKNLHFPTSVAYQTIPATGSTLPPPFTDIVLLTQPKTILLALCLRCILGYTCSLVHGTYRLFLKLDR